MKKVTSSIPSSTFGKIILWVEDNLTKEYLSEIWKPEITFFLFLRGAGSNVVHGSVNEHRLQGEGYVFGIVDRDFRLSNYPNWKHPNSDISVFRPTMHEIENYLLDWQALAGCKTNTDRYNRSANEIETRAFEFANKMTWWMACRSVLSKYRDDLIGTYPNHSSIENIQSQTDADNHFTQSDWYNSLGPNTSYILNSSSLSNDLLQAYATHNNQLANGDWIREFSGKELFRHIRGYIYNEKRSTREEMDIDLAKSVAEYQRDNKTVPNELLELKDAIKNRVRI